MRQEKRCPFNTSTGSCYLTSCVLWPLCSKLPKIVDRFLEEDYTKLSSKQAYDLFEFLNSKKEEK